jgi:transposase-like protein
MIERPRKDAKGGRINTYEETFKIAVAQEYLSGKLSQSQLAKKYNLPTAGTVHYFVRQYKENYENSTPKSAAVLPGDSVSDSKLEEELHLAKLKITALEMLIKNAEQELGVDIRKKSGIKRPVK